MLHGVSHVWGVTVQTAWLKSSSELQIRIEQVLTANLPLVLCFKVSQLLAFYGRTVEQMMGSGARLTDTLADCHKLANRVFHEQLTARGNKLMHFKAAPPKDLALPQQVLRPDYLCCDAELTACFSCCAVMCCAGLLTVDSLHVSQTLP